ncbi:MAG: hypothetical protein M1308_11965 [Actinobacteria bacterium]|nr:hypothetical protein [Actinomycetota bacterium]
MITMFEGLVDDKLDTTLIYQLFNMAKNEIEIERQWETLKELDESQSISSGHTYTTAKSLPARFLTSLSLYVGDDRIPYQQIPLEHRERYKEMTHRWYFKMIDSNFFICGTPATGTIHLFFIKSTADISSSQSWTFPAFAHPLIPIKAAKLFYPIDRIEKTRAYDDRWLIQENMIRRQLHAWDARLKKEAAKHHKYPFIPSTHSNIAW